MNFEKTYLSREMTRAMALDHPIGDPFGGPAYGERREPVSAILAIGSMVAGYGAATAAGATLGAMVLGGMAMAGGALSLIGNVSGNAKLQKFGAIVGLIGSGGLALSNLAQAGATTAVGEAAAGEAAKAGAETAAAAGGEAAASTAASTAAEAAAAPAAASTPQALQTANLTAPLEAPVTAAPSINAPVVEVPGVAPPVGPEVVMPPSAGPAMSFDSFGNPVPAGSPAALSADPSGLAQAQLDLNTAAAQPKGLIDSVKGFGSDLMNFTKTNPMGAYVAAQAVGGAADMLSGKSTAQKRQLQADAELRQAQADKTAYELQQAKDRLARLNAGYSQVNQGVTVNPNAVVAPVDPRTRFVMLPQAQTGLISGNRVG